MKDETFGLHIKEGFVGLKSEMYTFIIEDKVMI